MAKALLVTYLIVSWVAASYAYERQCAIGPEYWCKSFETAQDCGALRHCTNTVWRYDGKHARVDSSTKCEWCQKILENSQQKIQHLANNEDLIKSSLLNGCELFPLSSDASKCTNTTNSYDASVISLMKNKRYATLCRLMDICLDETVPESSSTEKPKLLGAKRCTWGPSYWCSSLSNWRECSATDHCLNNVWSKQAIEKKPNDNICQYCEFTVQKLRTIMESNKTEVDAEKWLSGACSMLPTKESIDDCVRMMSQYATEILVLIKNNIEPGIICHLSHMCTDATITIRVQIESPEEDIKEIADIVDTNSAPQLPTDEHSKILCNVIVRATHELHVTQQKSRNEIQTFLKNDCKKLSTGELIRKCEDLVEQYGHDIYGHVASNIELSKICDYMGNFADYSALQSLPSVRCELCTFVITTAKYMLDAKHTEDKVLLYIDEQMCSRLTGAAKTNCKNIIDAKGKDLINSIQRGTKSILICTNFQVCIDKVLDQTSPIDKNEKNSFLKENICENLGILKDACNALIDKDADRLMNTLVNDMDGDILCRMFGTCPKRLSLLDNLAVNDDKNKCQRCIDDFTRRKHIAEKLVNHSSEFLHHLCGQLPDKDDCIKTVDESINELVDFIRAMDPQDICIKLNYCNATMLETIRPTPFSSIDNVMRLIPFLTRDSLNCTLCKLAFGTIKKALTTNKTEQEIIQYVKVEICSKLGALAELCTKTIETEGPNMLLLIAKEIDPKKACITMGICPQSSAFENCNDKCECCMSKVQNHEVQVRSLLRLMVQSIRTLCERMPRSDQCLEMINKYNKNLDQLISHVNTKRVCQVLNHCSASSVEIETLPQCQLRLESKKQFLLTVITTVNQNLKSLCEYIPWNKDCYSIIDRSTLDVNNKLLQLNPETHCTSGRSLTDLICSEKGPFDRLCKYLVESDDNGLRMEAIFKSMFNQNGRVEKELCELNYKDQTSDCKPSNKLNKCNNKCDCCQQVYTKQKIYDLETMEKLRDGLLSTCAWSLSKDYCMSWFNRVCDRLKKQMDQFIPVDYCKQTDCSTDKQRKVQDCQIDGDKCQCCTKRLNSRQNRFRTTINEITTVLMSFCTDNDCRSLIQSTQQQSLGQVDKISSQTYCQRYGYCSPERSSQSTPYLSRLLINYNNHVGSSIEGLDQRFESSLSSDICFQYGQLRPMCEHLIASPDSSRYTYVYLALLKNDPKLIDDDLREQMATKAGADVCASCKDTVESSKDFLNNALGSARDSLLRLCERCPSKDKCRDYLNQQFDIIHSYINSINADQFCQSIHLCMSRSVMLRTDQCSKCVDSLESRKVSILQATNRAVAYFEDICSRFAGQQCQVFLKQIQDAIEESVQNINTKQTCQLIGFCSSTNRDTNQYNFDTYEKYLENEIDKNICSILGPFDSLCKQAIRGNIKQIQTVKINYNMKDLIQVGEERTAKNFFTAANINECNRDQCQCCVNQVNKKKDSAKLIGNNMISSLSSACDYCPAKDQCQKYWQDAQAKFSSYINNVDSKQICTRLGFCNASLLCKDMGAFRQSCEEALSAFTKTYKEDRETLERHLPHTSVVVLPTKSKEQTDVQSNSNVTCILCEYVMSILANYIHQNSTEEEIEQGLEKVCNQMPSLIRKQCHELIEDYGPPIIAILVQDFNVSAICRKLNLCTSQMKVSISRLTRKDETACSICDYVSTYVRFALKRDSSDKSLQHALSTVCTHLSNEQHSQCQTMVQLFSPHFRTLEFDHNDNFCQQLTICQTKTNAINVVESTFIRQPLKVDKTTKEDEELKLAVLKNLDITPQCTLCHYVVSYLDAVLKNNKSQEAVEAALEKVCTILPGKERPRCDEFVKNYGPVLAELIAEMADPDAICRYLGMCQVVVPTETTTKPTAPVTYSNHKYVRLPAEPKPYACTICQFLITRMKHFATLNQTEEEILASLKESCDLFSVINLKQQCRDFLDQYGPVIIQMISSDVDPKAACQNIGLCQKNVETSTSAPRRQSTPPIPRASSSIAYGKCIFGMNYWCTSRQNAELCNAVELCERQVWSKRNKNIII